VVLLLLGAVFGLNEAGFVRVCFNTGDLPGYFEPVPEVLVSVVLGENFGTAGELTLPVL
jgi:hypothetical protein